MKKIVQIYLGIAVTEDPALDREFPIHQWGDTNWPSLTAAQSRYPSRGYREVRVSE